MRGRRPGKTGGVFAGIHWGFFWPRTTQMSRIVHRSRKVNVGQAPTRLRKNSVGTPELHWSERLGQAWFLWFIWFIWLVSFNQIDKTDQTNRTDQINQINEIDQMNKTGDWPAKPLLLPLFLYLVSPRDPLSNCMIVLRMTL